MRLCHQGETTVSTQTGGLLSWRVTITICAAAAIVTLLGQEFAPSGGVAAVAGFSAGFLGSVFSTPRSTARTLVLVAGCVLVCTLFPFPWIGFLCGFVLISWAAIEGHTNGGFATIPALNGLLLYLLIAPDERTAFLALMCVVTAVVGGLLSVRLKLAGAANRPPMSLKGALSVWVFLLAGLALTSFLAHLIGNQKSYWLSFLFVFRVLAPLQKVPDAAARFGVGVALGSFIAIGLEFSGLPHKFLVVLGLAAAVFGVHRIGGNTIWTAMFFTIATLLITAPTIESAVFRIEAAAIVIAIVGCLAFLISWCWERIENRADNNRNSAANEGSDRYHRW